MSYHHPQNISGLTITAANVGSAAALLGGAAVALSALAFPPAAALNFALPGLLTAGVGAAGMACARSAGEAKHYHEQAERVAVAAEQGIDSRPKSFKAMDPTRQPNHFIEGAARWGGVIMAGMGIMMMLTAGGAPAAAALGANFPTMLAGMGATASGLAIWRSAGVAHDARQYSEMMMRRATRKLQRDNPETLLEETPAQAMGVQHDNHEHGYWAKKYLAERNHTNQHGL